MKRVCESVWEKIKKRGGGGWGGNKDIQVACDPFY